MGSHGGGTAEGQRQLIESYGITEAAVGCPIRSSMETVVVCRTAEGFPVHFDRHAFEADHVLVCGRVKPHTMFAGTIESGLMKMLLIGLGKCEGAGRLPSRHRGLPLRPDRPQRGRRSARQKCHILAGLAIVENAYDQTALIEAVAPARFRAARKAVAAAGPAVDAAAAVSAGRCVADRPDRQEHQRRRASTPTWSGRKFDDHKAVEGEWPKVKRIALRGLTPQSHGNAIGIGMAEFCRSQLCATPTWPPRD